MEPENIIEVPISSIIDNPYRNKVLNPIDEKRIQNLKASFERNGAWGAIPVRKIGKLYEQMAGHHRVEALRRLGVKKIAVSVAERDDEAMARGMIDENLTQDGKSAATMLDAVQAAIFVQAERNLNGILAVKSGAVAVTAPDFTKNWTSITQGIGYRQIYEYINAASEHPMISEQAVRDALKVIAEAGILEQLEHGVKVKYADQIAAYYERKVEKGEGGKSRMAKSLDLARAAEFRELKDEPPPKVKANFDISTAQEFETMGQFQGFQDVLLRSETIKNVIPLKKQAVVAKAVREKIDEVEKKRNTTIGGETVRQLTRDVIDDMAGKQKFKASEEEKARIAQENLEAKINHAWGTVLKGTQQALSALQNLQKLYGDRTDLEVRQHELMKVIHVAENIIKLGKFFDSYQTEQKRRMIDHG